MPPAYSKIQVRYGEEYTCLVPCPFQYELRTQRNWIKLKGKYPSDRKLVSSMSCLTEGPYFFAECLDGDKAVSAVIWNARYTARRWIMRVTIDIRRPKNSRRSDALVDNWRRPLISPTPRPRSKIVVWEHLQWILSTCAKCNNRTTNV